MIIWIDIRVMATRARIMDDCEGLGPNLRSHGALVRYHKKHAESHISDSQHVMATKTETKGRLGYAFSSPAQYAQIADAE